MLEKIKELVRQYAKAQEALCNLPCPRCGKFHIAVITSPSRCPEANMIAPIKVCGDCFQKERYEKLELEDWKLIRQSVPEVRIERRNEGKSYRLHDTSVRDIDLTNQDIDDIMCSALEGGITYWCNRCEVDGEYLGEYASDQISRGGSVRIHDTEEDEWHVLTLDKFLKGLLMALDNGYGSSWMEESNCYANRWSIDPGNIDAEAADIIIQYALFDDIIYG